MKILDGDHCVAILRGKLDLRDRVSPLEELAVTAISVGELTHDAHKSVRAAENLAQLDVLLAAFTVLPYDDAAGREFGALKAGLERSGQRLSDLDL
ncbi:MAG TPA: type II toxin-antitoxin system VapC family toxin, partial [Anaerolineae bacterium]